MATMATPRGPTPKKKSHAGYPLVVYLSESVGVYAGRPRREVRLTSHHPKRGQALRVLVGVAELGWLS